MKLMTTRLGSIEVAEKEIVFFPIGIPGFPDTRRYVLLDHDRQSPLKWLQAVEQPELAFPVVPATDILTDYHITISPDDLAMLALHTTEELSVYVVLTIPQDAPARTTANLKAPIVINPETKLGRQILTVEDYPIRYPLSAGEPAAVECAG